MLEFFKPLLALLIAALIAGFATVLNGLSGGGSRIENKTAEDLAIDKLSSAMSMNCISRDTILDDSGNPNRIYHLSDSAGNSGLIVRLVTPSFRDTSVHFAAAMDSGPALYSIAIHTDLSTGTIFSYVYNAATVGNLGSLRHDIYGDVVLVSPAIASLAAPILLSASHKVKGGRHAH